MVLKQPILGPVDAGAMCIEQRTEGIANSPRHLAVQSASD